jgi:hypothetical protein
MKRNSINLMLLAGIVVFSITSCKKNLVLIPNNELSSEQVFSTPAGYTEAMAKVYGAYATTGNTGPYGNADIQGVDEGTSDFWREFWNCEELTTDEAVITYGDPGVQPLHLMSWDENNQISQGLYYRSLYQITLCNNFLQQSTPSIVAGHGITGADATNIANYALEARFLRAYQYWVLMDVFGNPPFATETFKIGSGIPPQITRKALYAYVVGELKAIETLLPAPNKNLYGRVDQGAVWALLARIYLNAGIYTGTPDYADAITYCNKLISSNAYGLITNYQNLMLANNNLNTISGGGTVSEFILTINYDGVKSNGYGGSQYMTFAEVGGSMPVTDFGISGGYAGMRTTSNILSLFPSPATTDGSQFPSNGNADSRAQFWYPGQTTGIASLTTFTDGIPSCKFRDITSNGTPTSSESFTDMDLPLFRLPEIYLIYAEADMRLNGGVANATDVKYINAIRERAYTSNPAAGDITTDQLTLQFILDERGRELFWEGFRRTDLIRYGLFTTGSYLWPWKGGIAGGTSVADYRNLFPLPESDLSANPNLKQNTGY